MLHYFNIFILICIMLVFFMLLYESTVIAAAMFYCFLLLFCYSTVKVVSCWVHHHTLNVIQENGFNLLCVNMLCWLTQLKNVYQMESRL